MFVVPAIAVLAWVLLRTWGAGGIGAYLSEFDYPPTWLELATQLAAGIAAVWGYLRTVTAKGTPASA